MSQERFDWLERWCENPAEDVIRTFGTESNVKEIYDACNELAKDPTNVVLNQFCEFGNHLAHYEVTGRALGHVFDTVAARPSRPAPRRLRVGDRIGGHDRRRRPAQGRLRRPDRRRRGAGVPDDARQRLRRAQHPGHRRQAHPADPQRDEHRRRRRRQRPGHRPAAGDVRQRGRARLPRRPPARAPAGAAHAAPLRALVDLQRARRDRHGQAARPRSRRRHRHRRHRRGGDVPERAGQDPGPRLRRRVHQPRCRGGVGRAPRRRHHRQRRRVHRGRAQPHLQPRLLHVGRAAGHADRVVRGPPGRSRSGSGCGATSGCGTR